MSTPLGATPEQWAFWSAGLGLTADLLPVVADVTAKVSPMSKMRDVGKTPSKFNREGFIVGIPAWTQHRANDRQVYSWSTDGRLGVCVQTRTVRAIDIDIADRERSNQVRDLVEQHAGTLPRRTRSNSGKQLVMVVVHGDLSKRICRTDHGIIEFLADGQQFVAESTHPSGVRYEWEGLEGLDLVGLPEMSGPAFEALWAELVGRFGTSDSVNTRRTVAPSIPRSKLDMHGDPVVAFLHENDWVREFDRDGRVHVRCPWENEHTSDSGPTATSWFPAGVGGFMQGHFKCLHAHCAHRTDEQFTEAVGYDRAMFEDMVGAAVDDETAEFEVMDEQGQAVALREPEDGVPWPALTRDRAGRIEPTATNAQLALERSDITGWRLGYDAFMGRRVIAPEHGGTWREFKDSDYFMLRVALERRGFKGPGQDLVREAVRLVAERNTFDSAIDWAGSLQWDGVERIESFFPSYVGCEDTPYARSVGLYLWTALAGRALEPGCKVDMVPVLIGAQGSGKTSLVEALAPTEEAFVEINLEARGEEQMARSLRGKLVGEIAELRGLMTREAEDIKAWITRRWEEIRALYAEFHTKYPRRLVMIGTGNKDEFLDDETGERRWLPLRVGGTDLERLRVDRDQLWAEGVQRWREAGVQWREAQDLAVAEHAQFKVRDPWCEIVERWLQLDGMDGKEGKPRAASAVKSHDVLVGALRLDARFIGRKDEQRLGKVLRSLGFVRKTPRIEGKVERAWFKEQHEA